MTNNFSFLTWVDHSTHPVIRGDFVRSRIPTLGLDLIGNGKDALQQALESPLPLFPRNHP
ncbi:hypothetical protein HYC85_015317 [Camellia sinensis]|uniref:Uncharacterized protein n=1 Tax=Camellia sinensis TaxID=4442 RepID=A0A7J7GWH2_CAMSI|nr:hypothetical protein HYC85_015317 [Camellia sinensis]